MRALKARRIENYWRNGFCRIAHRGPPKGAPISRSAASLSADRRTISWGATGRHSRLGDQRIAPSATTIVFRKELKA